jgi:hypothetical protein
MTNGEGMTKSVLAHDASDKVFWNSQVPSVVREEASDKGVVYDLEERTARFGEAVIDFVKTIPQDAVTSRIISQLVGAATSVGANYVEADDAVSKRVSEKHWDVPERSTRDQAFSSHDCSSLAGAKTASSNPLD